LPEVLHQAQSPEVVKDGDLPLSILSPEIFFDDPMASKKLGDASVFHDTRANLQIPKR
jgi:hypothetical protein